MTYLTSLFLLGVVLGLSAVASNPSPFFAALGLVVVAGMGCGVLVASGGTFLSLILFLIYLGGMLVVFAYSAALAADSYPESWASWPVLMMMGFYLLVSLAVGGMFIEGEAGVGMNLGEGAYELNLGLGDVGGVALVYSMGGGLLVGAAWVLLLTLFVVLELTRGLSRGALRSV
uniref:NADH dehydrogenase subunit 6 n=1 Tax=Scartella cristata TaxID=195084 RepID=UPI002E7A1002|nr:NADH dehydrogenase subunit 6 [Scartella cristata]WQT71147.1 NADH dehydrogenase subunit 6 [Scartella cristata]WQT71160.1 NADH dehydrogenase subunit 6 [Scartella cristata]WQT73463.1 NADH dehydrogenase subunit 6 [Scartella cristata]WQT73476.1 NADH dehydrogenase subunit 6 [Scartella cristata]WQT73489.1 NADH dehydrogenase subunit 6 [Scartella cristata]